MATEYVDAGTAIPYMALSADIGHAPPVTKGVNYERILNARDEPQNWLTYYGAYDGQRYSTLDQINPEQRRQAQAAVGVPGRLDGPAFGRIHVRVGGRPDRRRRDHVRLRLGRPALCPRRGEGARAVALQACVPVRRVAVLRQRQPRGRGRRGQGLHDHPERARDRARRREREEDLGSAVRRRAGRRERHGRSPDRQGHGHRRELGRRVRGPRPHRRVQARDRRARLALLHGPQARRAGLRDLARPTARPGPAAARTAGSRPPTTRR